MNSMTGFGCGVFSAGGGRLRVEIRSVNSRGLDVKVRGRDLDAACEVEIIRAARVAFERGGLLVTVREEGGQAPMVESARARATYAALEALRAELGLPGSVDLATVAAFMNGGAAGADGGPIAWDAVRPAMEEALRALRASRAQEGQALAADLTGRLATLRGIAATIATAARSLPTRAAMRLEQRLKVLAVSAPLDPARLAQEVALLADKLDVSEELARLDAHLSHLVGLLAPEAQPAGRKIDFVVQEIGRELNTIASKVQDAEMAALVVEGKAELEKIREQAQNVE